MKVIKTNKSKANQSTTTYPPNYEAFFAKKAADMKVLLEKNPVPSELFRK